MFTASSPSNHHLPGGTLDPSIPSALSAASGPFDPCLPALQRDLLVAASSNPGHSARWRALVSYQRLNSNFKMPTLDWRLMSGYPRHWGTLRLEVDSPSSFSSVPFPYRTHAFVPGFSSLLQGMPSPGTARHCEGGDHLPVGREGRRAHPGFSSPLPSSLRANKVFSWPSWKEIKTTGQAVAVLSANGLFKLVSTLWCIMGSFISHVSCKLVIVGHRRVCLPGGDWCNCGYIGARKLARIGPWVY